MCPNDDVNEQRRYAKHKPHQSLSCGISEVPQRNEHEGPGVKPGGARDVMNTRSALVTRSASNEDLALQQFSDVGDSPGRVPARVQELC